MARNSICMQGADFFNLACNVAEEFPNNPEWIKQNYAVAPNGDISAGGIDSIALIPIPQNFRYILLNNVNLNTYYLYDGEPSSKTLVRRIKEIPVGNPSIPPVRAMIPCDGIKYIATYIKSDSKGYDFSTKIKFWGNLVTSETYMIVGTLTHIKVDLNTGAISEDLGSDTVFKVISLDMEIVTVLPKATVDTFIGALFMYNEIPKVSTSMGEKITITKDGLDSGVIINQGKKKYLLISERKLVLLDIVRLNSDLIHLS